MYLLEIFVQEGEEDSNGYPIPDEQLLIRLSYSQRDDLDSMLQEAADYGNDLVHHWKFTEIAESEFESVRTLIEDEYFDQDDDYESEEFDDERENEEGQFFGDDNEH